LEVGDDVFQGVVEMFLGDDFLVVVIGKDCGFVGDVCKVGVGEISGLVGD